MQNYSKDGAPAVSFEGRPLKLGLHRDVRGSVLTIKNSGFEPKAPSDWLEVDFFQEIRDILAPDQGQTGASVAYSVAFAVEILRRRNLEEPITPSANYLYAHVNGGKDVGCTFEDAIQTALEKGVCKDSLVPKTTITFAGLSAEAHADAAKRKIDAASLYCSGFNDIMTAVQHQFPTVVGLMIGPNFARTGKDGIVKLAPTTHGAMSFLVAGAKKIDNEWYLKAMLSWGPSFGDNGFVYLHSSLLTRTVGAYALVDHLPTKFKAPNPLTEECVIKKLFPPTPVTDVEQKNLDNPAWEADLNPTDKPVKIVDKEVDAFTIPFQKLPDGHVNLNDDKFLAAVNKPLEEVDPKTETVQTESTIKTLDGTPVVLSTDVVATPAAEAPPEAAEAISAQVTKVTAEAVKVPLPPALPKPPASVKPQTGHKPKDKKNHG